LAQKAAIEARKANGQDKATSYVDGLYACGTAFFVCWAVLQRDF
jgi:hypothetical protein